MDKGQDFPNLGVNPNDLIRMLDATRLMGKNDFKLRLDQVLDESFNEQILEDVIKLRAEGRATTNAEAFDMIKGLNPEDIKKVVKKGLTKAQIESQKNFEMQVEGSIVPQISFLPKPSMVQSNTSVSFDSFLRPSTPEAQKPRRSQSSTGMSPERKKSKSEKNVRFKL